MSSLNLPSPLHQLHIKNDQDIRFFVKRDDLIHKDISGNKWRKLLYQIKEAQEKRKEGIITFGGAFSNHIVATAAACRMHDLQSVGIIRGESTALKNPSLQKASQYGMNFHFVSRSDYKLKEDSETIQHIISDYPDHLLVPEGGRHKNAVPGVAEVCQEIQTQSTEEFDYLLCAIGTGTTFAGFVDSFGGDLIGINVLKNKSVVDDVCGLLGRLILESQHTIIHDYHFGGYAKFTPELISFMHELYEQYGIQTDVIYTSKLFFAVLDLLNKQYFKQNSKVMIYHSGGLQGNAGMNYRFPGLIKFN